MSASVESVRDNVRNTVRHELINRTIDGKLSFEDYILAIEHNVHACFDDANKVKAHLNTRDKQGRSLLHHAVMKNNDSLTTKLVYFGFDIDQLDAEGHTPFDYAFINQDIIKDSNKSETNSTVQDSIESIRRTLLQLGATVKASTEALKAWIENYKNVKKGELAESPAADVVKLKNTLTEKKHFDELRAQILLKDKIVPYQKWSNLKSTYDLFHQIFSVEALILAEFDARSAKGDLGDAKSSVEKETISGILAMIDNATGMHAAAASADVDQFIADSNARMENLKRESMKQESAAFMRALEAQQEKDRNAFLKQMEAMYAKHKALVSSLDDERARLSAGVSRDLFAEFAAKAQENDSKNDSNENDSNEFLKQMEAMRAQHQALMSSVDEAHARIAAELRRDLLTDFFADKDGKVGAGPGASNAKP